MLRKFSISDVTNRSYKLRFSRIRKDRRRREQCDARESEVDFYIEYSVDTRKHIDLSNTHLCRSIKNFFPFISGSWKMDNQLFFFSKKIVGHEVNAAFIFYCIHIYFTLPFELMDQNEETHVAGQQFRVHFGFYIIIR